MLLICRHSTLLALRIQPHLRNEAPRGIPKFQAILIVGHITLIGHLPVKCAQAHLWAE